MLGAGSTGGSLIFSNTFLIISCSPSSSTLVCVAGFFAAKPRDVCYVCSTSLTLYRQSMVCVIICFNPVVVSDVLNFAHVVNV